MIVTYTKEAALGVLDRANRTRVPPELLVEAIELFAEMPCEEEQSVFDVRTPRLVDFLRAKGFSGRHHADLVVAIIFRSYALAHLVRCEPVNGWIISAEDRDPTACRGHQGGGRGSARRRPRQRRYFRCA
jgi:hypothetical protein